MTEQEAVESLAQNFLGEEAPQEAPQGEAQPPQQAEDNSFDVRALLEAQNSKIDKLSEEIRAGSEKETKGQNAPQVSPEEQALMQQVQEQMGIDQLKQQQEELMEQLAFERAWDKFEREHPEVTKEELGKWAEENDFAQYLSEPRGWELIHKAMGVQAQPKEKPDQIIPQTPEGAGVSAFDRLKKGEEVSDIDLGLEILKASE